LTATVRYGAKPPAARVDHEIDATKAPIATEAITVTYLTDPDIVRQVLPEPLRPSVEPIVRISLQRVVIDGRPPFGSAVFSVAARHEDLEGDYPLFMPQSTEQSVTGGRETFGEPKKLAEINVERQGDAVEAHVRRLGFDLITVAGRITQELAAPPDQTNTEFYFKFLRAPDGGGITDPHLVHGRYHRHYELLEAIEGTVELGDSPLDPVADIEVKELRSITWCRRRTIQTATIARAVPQEWLLPYVHQRYDDLALLASRPPGPAAEAPAPARA
jgi:acetoacetate decarboxylase